jgi:hypothetical protein
MLEVLSALIPAELLDRSGSVFYSGRQAFSGTKPIYLLGLNPGGDPVEMSDETIRLQVKQVLERTQNNWSAYRDESWGNAPKGTWRMQPRVRHLIAQLGLDPGEVPASNIIFVRSREAHGIVAERNALAAKCWPFHQRVITELRVQTVICFGNEAGWWVRLKMGADRLVGEFFEVNNRRWGSSAFQNMSGKVVITLSHPSRSDWASPPCDPSSFVRAHCGTLDSRSRG